MKTVLVVAIILALSSNAQAQSNSSSSDDLGKCKNIFSSECETLYESYSAMEVAKLEQRFESQDTTMSFDELSILKKAYSETRIKGIVSKKSGAAGSGASEALVTFARSCCVYNNFKTYGQFLNLIKVPVYGQADCLAAQTSTAKDSAIEASQAAQVRM